MASRQLTSHVKELQAGIDTPIALAGLHVLLGLTPDVPHFLIILIELIHELLYSLLCDCPYSFSLGRLEAGLLIFLFLLFLGLLAIK